MITKTTASISYNLPLMDTPITENQSVSIKGFVASKQTYLFNTLKKHQFSGELLLVQPGKAEWRFYLSLGRIIYGTGGEHSVRRWRRNLAANIPEIATDQQYLEKEIHSISSDTVKFCWEYELVRRWLLEGRASREQAMKMINSIITEIFFDLNQAAEITFHLNSNIHIPMEEQMFLLDANQVIVPGWREWQTWMNAKLGDRSPNKAPVIKQPEQLKQKTTPKTYSAFTKLLNGRNTLRDLALTFKRDLTQLGNLLLPYIQQGYLELVTVADLPSPVSPRTIIQREQNPLIACIDDSPMICQIMETILKPNYRFLGITEPMKAIAEILASKPDLIFLDLMMPHTSGYEICSSLRKLSLFRQTPIIIITSNDTVVQRMRTKIIGASDFMAKPIDPKQVINMIHKYLN